MGPEKTQPEVAQAQPPGSPPLASAGLVRSATLTLGTRLATFILSLVTNIVLARALGPEGRGIYAVAVLIPGLISLLLGFGISPANVYHYSKKLITADDLIGTGSASAIALGVVLYVALFVFVRESGLSLLAGIKPAFLLISCLSVPFLLETAVLQGLLIGAERFILYNATFLTQSAATAVGVIVIVVFFRGSTTGAIIAWTASAAVAAGVALVCVRTLGRLSLRWRWATLRPLLRFGVLSYLSSLTSFVNLRFDLLLVNLFSGARQAGLYSVATSLAEMVWYVANSAGTVLAPRVASAEPERADRLTESVCRVVVFSALVGAALLGLLAPFVIGLFFGSAFGESKWAVWLLMPGIVTFSVARVLSMYLLGRNRLTIDLLASSVAFVVTLALDLALIPPFGFLGAAVASSIAYSCAMAVGLVWVARRSTITASALLIVRRSDIETVARRVRETGGLLNALGREAGLRRSRRGSGDPGARIGS